MIVALLQFIRSLLTSFRPQPKDFAGRIMAAMQRKGFKISAGFGERNIVYVPGYNPDGTSNGNPPNDTFNDLRIVFVVENGRPRIIYMQPATVDPGHYYDDHPMNPNGTAQIKYGAQFTAWQVGVHRGDHEALVQTGGTVTVIRDGNVSHERDVGDTTDTGHFGINQHGPGTHSQGTLTKVGPHSAGCLVVPSMTAQREFMSVVKLDPRYVANKRFIFTTAILDPKDPI